MRAPRLRGGVAVLLHGGAAAQALARLKYRDRPDLALPLGRLLARAVAEADARGTFVEAAPARVIVPVPLHSRRLAERGFNHAALLAAAVARSVHAPLAARALERTRDTYQQATLTRRERVANVAGAFRVRTPDTVRGASVVLVDDVRTTGATLAACTDALLRAQASEVTWATFAMAPSGAPIDDTRLPGLTRAQGRDSRIP
jgi:ComF family protein